MPVGRHALHVTFLIGVLTLRVDAVKVAVGDSFCGATSAARAFRSPPILDKSVSKYSNGELTLTMWMPESYKPKIVFYGARNEAGSYTGRDTRYWKVSRDGRNCRKGYRLVLPWREMNPGGDDLGALKVVESGNGEWLWLGRMQVNSDVTLDLAKSGQDPDLAKRLGKRKIKQTMEWMVPFKIDFPASVVSTATYRIVPMTPIVYAAILVRKRYDVLKLPETGHRTAMVNLTVIHSVQYPFRAIPQGVKLLNPINDVASLQDASDRRRDVIFGGKKGVILPDPNAETSYSFKASDKESIQTISTEDLYAGKATFATPGSTGYAVQPSIRLAGSSCRKLNDYRDGQKDIAGTATDIKMCVQQWEIGFVVNSCRLSGEWTLTWQLQCAPRVDARPLGCVYNLNDKRGAQMSKPAVYKFKLTDANLCVKNIDDIPIDSSLTPYQTSSRRRKKLAWVNGQKIFFESSMRTNAANFKSATIIAVYGRLDANGDGSFSSREKSIAVWRQGDPYDREVNTRGIDIKVNRRYFDRQKRDRKGWSTIKNKFELTLNSAVFPPPEDQKTSLLITAELRVEYRGGPTRRMLLTTHRIENPSTVITLEAANSESEYLRLIPTPGMFGEPSNYLVIATAILVLALVFFVIFQPTAIKQEEAAESKKQGIV